jgi:predicted DNA-binding transcriptional regulator AlpA
MQVHLLQQTDFDRLIESLKEQIRSEIQSIKAAEPEEKPLHPPDAAIHLGISRATLFKRINRGELPPRVVHRNGKSLYFFKSELNEFIKSC